MLLGRQLKDFLPSKPDHLPPLGSHKDLSSTWQEIAEWRELALAKRSAKDQENLSTHVKEHAPLELGDHVMVQNQAGNQPLRWSKRGVVVQVLPNRQYQVRMDGSRRITLRNRKFLRKFTPLHEDPSDTLRKLPSNVPEHTPTGQQATHTYPAVPDLPTADPVGNWYSQQDPRSHLATPPEQQQSSTVPTSPATMPTTAPAPAVRDWSPPVQMAQPQHAMHPQNNQPISAGQQEYHQPAGQLPVPTPEEAPLPTLMHPTSSPVRRSSRSTRGVTSRFSDYTPGAEFDVSSLSPPCDQYFSYAQAMRHHQQPVCHAVQSLSGTDQQYAPYPAYPHNPFNAYIAQYHQQYDAQHMAQMVSHDENRVFVSDGHSWKEYNLEKVFS